MNELRAAQKDHAKLVARYQKAITRREELTVTIWHLRNEIEEVGMQINSLVEQLDNG